MPALEVIIASTRPGRVGPDIGAWFARHAVEHGAFEVRVTDLATLALPFLDEPEHPATRRYTQQHTKDWSRTVDAADAFAFVVPEYNFGFNAPVKNAIDYLYHEWRYKPVGFVSYGMGSAGMRAVQMLKQVVTTLRMVPIGDTVAIPLRTHVDEDGRFTPTTALDTAARATLDELAGFAAALEPLRRNARA
ncbi:NAD(P)H-dependent oxidoreductase [Actinokineospora soli]